jgi:hypothetical protein
MSQIYSSTPTRFAGEFARENMGSVPKPDTTHVTTTRVQLDSFMDKKSFHFREVRPRVYSLEFTVSSASGCVVQVYYLASEDASGRITSQLNPVTMQLPPGKDQHIAGESVLLDLATVSESQLRCSGSTYPLGILIVKVT